VPSPFYQCKNPCVKHVCKYHVNPIGINIEKPRFCWQSILNAENVTQLAFEIKVADSPKNLNIKSGLILSSGKVDSDQSVNVGYGEPALKSM